MDLLQLCIQPQKKFGEEQLQIPVSQAPSPHHSELSHYYSIQSFACTCTVCVRRQAPTEIHNQLTMDFKTGYTEHCNDQYLDNDQSMQMYKRMQFMIAIVLNSDE